jgi:hypothetical protein
MRFKKEFRDGDRFIDRRRANAGQTYGNIAQPFENRAKTLREKSETVSGKSKGNIAKANELADKINRSGFFGRRGEGVDTFGDVMRMRRYNRLVGSAEEQKAAEGDVAGRAGRQQKRAGRLEDRAGRMDRFGNFFRRLQDRSIKSQAKSDQARAEFMASPRGQKKAARQQRRRDAMGR